jgi:hypothetical protein
MNCTGVTQGPRAEKPTSYCLSYGKQALNLHFTTNRTIKMDDIKTIASL